MSHTTLTDDLLVMVSVSVSVSCVSHWSDDGSNKNNNPQNELQSLFKDDGDGHREDDVSEASSMTVDSSGNVIFIV